MDRHDLWTHIAIAAIMLVATTTTVQNPGPVFAATLFLGPFLIVGLGWIDHRLSSRGGDTRGGNQ